MSVGYRKMKADSHSLWAFLVIICCCSLACNKEPERKVVTEEDEFQYVFTRSKTETIPEDKIKSMKYDLGKQAAYLHNLLVFFRIPKTSFGGVPNKQMTKEQLPIAREWYLSRYAGGEALMKKVKAFRKGGKYDHRLIKITLRFGETGDNNGRSHVKRVELPSSKEMLFAFIDATQIGITPKHNIEIANYYILYRDFYAEIFDDGIKEEMEYEKMMRKNKETK